MYVHHKIIQSYSQQEAKLHLIGCNLELYIYLFIYLFIYSFIHSLIYLFIGNKMFQFSLQYLLVKCFILRIILPDIIIIVHRLLRKEPVIFVIF
jgi:hypothetical protein